MSEDQSTPVPGHVRRQLRSETARMPDPAVTADDDDWPDEPVMFVEVPESSTSAPTGSAMQDQALVRLVENALEWAGCRLDEIAALPFVTTPRCFVHEKERVLVFAREERGGIYVGVKDYRNPDLDIPGILLRRAPEPFVDGFTLTGRGALETRACNGFVAGGALGAGLRLMVDELAAIYTRNGGLRIVAHPWMGGSMFDQAFPEWEEFTGVARESSEDVGNAPRF